MTAILRHRITPAEFVTKWRPVTLTERAAAQEHFIDLCRLFDHPTPVEDDPTGERFTFEKGVQKSSGRDGFADVWKKGFFAWEYKKRKRSLTDALDQLSRYALALESPPLQVACDTDRIRIVTAKTNTAPRAYDLTLEEVLDPKKREPLELAFHDPDKLVPGDQRAYLTRQAADKFSTLAQRLQAKDHPPEHVGHYVNQLVFLFFAEDVGLLSKGYFRRTISELSGRPSEARDILSGMFRTFKTGGRFGLDRLPWINGGLFDDREALPLDEHEIGLLKAASSQDWAHIDPTIFGTLFERFLDPDKRAQIGAHYTDYQKIEQIIEPVILQPLRTEWHAAYADIAAAVKSAQASGIKSRFWQRAEERRSAFLERLRTVSILDPACGSGNFLYVALQAVKNLEHAANQACESLGLPPRMPMVGPEILRGIEINPLAAELARTTIWIGDIQWAKQNAIHSRPEPILRRLDVIECRDALLSCSSTSSKGDLSDQSAVAAPWPDAEFIIGNPPFLGGKMLRRALGDEYANKLFRAYEGRVPQDADLVVYWFERAREALQERSTSRVGLVSTQSIRRGASGQILKRIVQTGRIFDAWQDEPWTVDGADVRVSLVCFQRQNVGEARLNGLPVLSINADLSASKDDLTTAVTMTDNLALSFQGPVKVGPFEIEGALARKWLQLPSNPNGKNNADVLKPWANGIDLARRPTDRWIIDFGTMPLSEAQYYEAPFQHVLQFVKPARDKNRDPQRRQYWWRLGRSGSDLKAAVSGLRRQIVTPRVAKHRFFVWASSSLLPDSRVVTIARDDDFTYGVLSSRFHEAWTLCLGGWHGIGNDPQYTPSLGFETFPFPDGLTPNLPVATLTRDGRSSVVAEAAIALNRSRSAWMNPPELIRSEPEVFPDFPDRLVPRSADAARLLATRTFTALYNARPAWLTDLHEKLDAAVAAAYGWPEDISTEDALARLLELNRERAAAQGGA